jgi:hypothetical protein
MESLWNSVDTNWGDILRAFRGRTEHMMYNKEGILVESNRPLIESLVDAKMQRCSTFWYYMEDLMRDRSIVRKGNEIHVGVGTPLPLSGGGAEEYVQRVNDN